MFRFCGCCSNYAAAKVVAVLVLISVIGNVVAAGLITYFVATGLFDTTDWVVVTWLMFMASLIATICIIVGLARRSHKLLYAYIFMQAVQMILTVVLLILVITGLSDTVLTDAGPVAGAWIGTAVIALIFLWFMAIGFGASAEIREMVDSFGGYHRQSQQRVVYTVGK